MTTKKKVLYAMLSFLTPAFYFFAWLSVDRAVNIPDSSTWLVPFVWFGLAFIVTALDIVLIRERFWTETLILISFVLSFIFGVSLVHLITFIFSFAFFLAAKQRIRNDLELNIKVCLRKSVRAGAYLLILALTLLITSQYYIQAKRADVKKIIPHIDVSRSADKLVRLILKTMNPEFKNVDEGDFTVDDLILDIKQKQLGGLGTGTERNQSLEMQIQSQIPGGVTPEQRALIEQEVKGRLEQAKQDIEKESQDFILQEGRKYFSELSGFPVTGKEKVSDVFMGILNKKVDDYFNPKIATTEDDSILPAIMTGVLFITVLSIGAVADFWLILLANASFFLLVKTGAVNLTKVMKEVEIIE